MTGVADRGELAYQRTAVRITTAGQRSPEKADGEVAVQARWGRQL